MPQTATVPAIGSTMPELTLIGPDGESSTLSTHLGAKPLIVHFMRSSSCPVCVGHSRAIVELIESGRVDAAFLAIAPGSSADAATATQRIGRAVASVWASGDSHAEIGLGRFLALQHSGTFVISPDGIVLDATVNAIPTKSYSRDAVLAALSGVRE